MTKKPPEKNRAWEKVRRDRLNNSFKELAKLLPKYDPSIIWSKIEIILKSIAHIKELHERHKEYLREKDPQALKQHNELIEALNYYQLRNGQLSELLKKAEITAPPFNLPKFLIDNPHLNGATNTKAITEIFTKPVGRPGKYANKIKENLNEINKSSQNLSSTTTQTTTSTSIPTKINITNNIQQNKTEICEHQNDIELDNNSKPLISAEQQKAIITAGILVPVVPLQRIQHISTINSNSPLKLSTISNEKITTSHSKLSQKHIKNPLPSSSVTPNNLITSSFVTNTITNFTLASSTTTTTTATNGTTATIIEIPSNTNIDSTKKIVRKIARDKDGKVKILPQPRIKIYLQRSDGKVPIPVLNSFKTNNVPLKRKRKRKRKADDEQNTQTINESETNIDNQKMQNKTLKKQVKKVLNKKQKTANDSNEKQLEVNIIEKSKNELEIDNKSKENSKSVTESKEKETVINEDDAMKNTGNCQQQSLNNSNTSISPTTAFLSSFPVVSAPSSNENCDESINNCNENLSLVNINQPINKSSENIEIVKSKIKNDNTSQSVVKEEMLEHKEYKESDNNLSKENDQNKPLIYSQQTTSLSLSTSTSLTKPISNSNSSTVTSTFPSSTKNSIVETTWCSLNTIPSTKSNVSELDVKMSETSSKNMNLCTISSSSTVTTSSMNSSSTNNLQSIIKSQNNFPTNVSNQIKTISENFDNITSTSVPSTSTMSCSSSSSLSTPAMKKPQNAANITSKTTTKFDDVKSIPVSVSSSSSPTTTSVTISKTNIPTTSTSFLQTYQAFLSHSDSDFKYTSQGGKNSQTTQKQSNNTTSKILQGNSQQLKNDVDNFVSMQTSPYSSTTSNSRTPYTAINSSLNNFSSTAMTLPSNHYHHNHLHSSSFHSPYLPSTNVSNYPLPPRTPFPCASDLQPLVPRSLSNCSTIYPLVNKTTGYFQQSPTTFTQSSFTTSSFPQSNFAPQIPLTAYNSSVTPSNFSYCTNSSVLQPLHYGNSVYPTTSTITNTTNSTGADNSGAECLNFIPVSSSSFKTEVISTTPYSKSYSTNNSSNHTFTKTTPSSYNTLPVTVQTSISHATTNHSSFESTPPKTHSSGFRNYSPQHGISTFVTSSSFVPITSSITNPSSVNSRTNLISTNSLYSNVATTNNTSFNPTTTSIYSNTCNTSSTSHISSVTSCANSIIPVSSVPLAVTSSGSFKLCPSSSNFSYNNAYSTCYSSSITSIPPPLFSTPLPSSGSLHYNTKMLNPPASTGEMSHNPVVSSFSSQNSSNTKFIESSMPHYQHQSRSIDNNKTTDFTSTPIQSTCITTNSSKSIYSSSKNYYYSPSIPVQETPNFSFSLTPSTTSLSMSGAASTVAQTNQQNILKTSSIKSEMPHWLPPPLPSSTIQNSNTDYKSSFTFSLTPTTPTYSSNKEFNMHSIENNTTYCSSQNTLTTKTSSSSSSSLSSTMPYSTSTRKTRNPVNTSDSTSNLNLTTLPTLIKTSPTTSYFPTNFTFSLTQSKTSITNVTHMTKEHSNEEKLLESNSNTSNSHHVSQIQHQQQQHQQLFETRSKNEMQSIKQNNLCATTPFTFALTKTSATNTISNNSSSNKTVVSTTASKILPSNSNKTSNCYVENLNHINVASSSLTEQGQIVTGTFKKPLEPSLSVPFKESSENQNYARNSTIPSPQKIHHASSSSATATSNWMTHSSEFNAPPSLIDYCAVPSHPYPPPPPPPHPSASAQNFDYNNRKNDFYYPTFPTDDNLPSWSPNKMIDTSYHHSTPSTNFGNYHYNDILPSSGTNVNSLSNLPTTLSSTTTTSTATIPVTTSVISSKPYVVDRNINTKSTSNITSIEKNYNKSSINSNTPSSCNFSVSQLVEQETSVPSSSVTQKNYENCRNISTSVPTVNNNNNVKSKTLATNKTSKESKKSSNTSAVNYSSASSLTTTGTVEINQKLSNCNANNTTNTNTNNTYSTEALLTKKEKCVRNYSNISSNTTDYYNNHIVSSGPPPPSTLSSVNPVYSAAPSFSVSSGNFTFDNIESSSNSNYFYNYPSNSGNCVPEINHFDTIYPSDGNYAKSLTNSISKSTRKLPSPIIPSTSQSYSTHSHPPPPPPPHPHPNFVPYDTNYHHYSVPLGVNSPLMSGSVSQPPSLSHHHHPHHPSAIDSYGGNSTTPHYIHPPPAGHHNNFQSTPWNPKTASLNYYNLADQHHGQQPQQHYINRLHMHQQQVVGQNIVTSAAVATGNNLTNFNLTTICPEINNEKIAGSNPW